MPLNPNDRRTSLLSMLAYENAPRGPILPNMILVEGPHCSAHYGLSAEPTEAEKTPGVF